MSSIQERNDGDWDDWDVVLSCVLGFVNEAGSVGISSTQIASLLSIGEQEIREAIEELSAAGHSYFTVRGQAVVVWAGPMSLRRRGPSSFR